MQRDDYFDQFQSKLKLLNSTLWEDKAKWPHVEKWLSQFKTSTQLEQDEQLQVLFLATHFMYFGVREIRALLRSMFRDLVQYGIIQNIRKKHANTRTVSLIENELKNSLRKTRFLAMGNPSESGSHLLYYFRQENGLGKEYFIHSHEIFKRTENAGTFTAEIADMGIDHYIFVDDLCGSGTQAKQYSENVVQPIKKQNTNARVSYFTLFATSFGLNEVRKLNLFDEVAAVVELDDSFKCFSSSSRVFKNEQYPIDKTRAEEVCKSYGDRLCPNYPLGWRDGQLLIGFCHNTPDNTLPIIWFDEPDGNNWNPLFKRSPKHYGWEL
jgi:hypothetical protein